MHFRFGLISQDELASFLEGSNARYFYSQSAEYINVCKAMKRPYDILALRNDEEILAAGIVFKYRFKKIFQKAELIFGPVIKNENPGYFIEFMKHTVDFYKKKLRVISLEVVPLILDRYFNDIEVIGENPNSQIIKNELSRIGFKHIDKDFTESPNNIQVKYIYVKEILGLGFKELQKSFTYNLRNEFKKARELGIQVRFLKPSEMDIFDNIIAKTSKRLEHDISLATTKFVAENFSEAYYPVSFIDVDYSVKMLTENIDKANAEVLKLQKDIEEFGENKKRLNKLNDANIILQKAKEKLETVEGLRDKYGDIVYMSTGSFYYSPTDLVYLQGGMLREFEAFYPNHALLEKMIKLAIEKECKYFNFFGVSAASLVDENAADYGVLQFKRNFSGEIQEFLGTFEYSYVPFI